MNYEIFQIEADPQILKYQNEEGEPIWMFMRYIVLYDIMSQKLLNATGINNARHMGKDAIKYLLKATLHNIQFRLNSNSAEIMFYTSSRGVLQDGKYLNQYVDRYAAAINESSVSIEHPPLDWKWHSSRINNNVIYDGPNLALVSALAKVNKRDVESVEKLFGYVNRRIKKLFGILLDDIESEYVIRLTCYEMLRMNAHARWILKKVTRYKAKVAIIIGGSYSWYYPINRLLKKNGIVTADLQHGYITSSNIVYNYSSELLMTEEVKIASPDYLLTYGKWWNEQSNLPYKEKIIIGNPFRNDMKNRFNLKNKRDKVLLIGCARNTIGYMKLAEELNKVFDTFKVIFRPHPSERYDVQQLIKNKSTSLTVDYDSNLYQLLEETEVVISEISTVLFESIGLVPRIVVWRTEFSQAILPKCPFENFKTIEDLNKLVSYYNNESLCEKHFWDDNWEDNFKKFVKII